METRSMSRLRQPLASAKHVTFDVNIDFDEASAAWHANKKSMGNGTYKYLCNALNSSTGKTCKRVTCKNGNQYEFMLACMNKSPDTTYCTIHCR
jgi:hypothetical protein